MVPAARQLPVDVLDAVVSLLAEAFFHLPELFLTARAIVRAEVYLSHTALDLHMGADVPGPDLQEEHGQLRCDPYDFPLFLKHFPSLLLKSLHDSAKGSSPFSALPGEKISCKSTLMKFSLMRFRDLTVHMKGFQTRL